VDLMGEDRVFGISHVESSGSSTRQLTIKIDGNTVCICLCLALFNDSAPIDMFIVALDEIS
jgi:hypothetical protein